jgi:hypothetical protein
MSSERPIISFTAELEGPAGDEEGREEDRQKALSGASEGDGLALGVEGRSSAGVSATANLQGAGLVVLSGLGPNYAAILGVRPFLPGGPDPSSPAWLPDPRVASTTHRRVESFPASNCSPCARYSNARSVGYPHAAGGAGLGGQ